MRDERFGAEAIFHGTQHSPSSPRFVGTDLPQDSSVASVVSDLQATVLPIPVKPTPKSSLSSRFDGLFETRSDYPADHCSGSSPTTTEQITCVAGSADSFHDAHKIESHAAKSPLFCLAGEDIVGSNTSVSRFNVLPPEIRLRIFRLLKMEELVRISRVCRYWFHLVYDGSLWSRLDIRPVCRSISNDRIVHLTCAAGHFLRTVNFRGCVHLSSSTLRRLSETCPNIRAAQLTGCRSVSSRSLIRFVTRCRYLESLDVSGLGSVNGAVLNALAESNQEHLRSLRVAHCRNVKGKDVHRVLETRQNMTSIHLGACRTLDGSVFSLIDRQVGLRHLSVAHCGFVRSVHLRTLFSSGNRPLISLAVAGNPFVCDEDVRHVATRCPRLRHLDAEECTRITDASLFCLAEHTPELRILSVAECDHVTDVGIARLVAGCRMLQRLEMDCCGSVTDVALRGITEILQARSVSQSQSSASSETPVFLSEIDVFDCRSITSRGIRQVGANIRTLNVKSFTTWQDREEEQRRAIGRAESTAVEQIGSSNIDARRNSAHRRSAAAAACTIL